MIGALVFLGIIPGPRVGEQRPMALIDELDKAGYTAAAKCLADDLAALVVHLRYRYATVGGGDRPTCSRDRWARSSAARR